MKRIVVVQDNITTLQVDAIVNAANSTLLGGGGVDGAIHRAAGPELLAECRTLNGCQTGEAKITKGYQLPAKYVIHTVGPVYGRNPTGQSTQLQNCYLNSLKLAIENACKTIAFPNISTGVYGYPKAEAASIAVNTVSDFLKSNKSVLQVMFACFDRENYTIYKELLGI